jgi:hypothetical protein
MKMTKKKIFIGLDDTAAQIADWELGFNENGYECITAIHNRDSVFKTSKVDFQLDKFVKRKEWVGYFRPGRISVRLKPWWDNYIENFVWNKVMEECDIFVFIWSTFRFDNTDMIELRKAGKKIINIFVGDDVRWYNGMKQEFEKYNIPAIEYGPELDLQSATTLGYRLNRLRYSEKYSEFVVFLQGLSSAQLALRPFYNLPALLNAKAIKENPKQRKIPLVIHAPSSSAVKGTKYVLDCFERLKKENVPFEMKLISNLPNKQALVEYSNADILVGQMFCPGGGKQELEGMAAGKVVLSSKRPQYPQRHVKNSPVIDVDPLTLYVELKKIIYDYPRRCELVKNARAFVEAVHAPKVVCKQLLSILQCPEEEREYDYKPDFYRNEFIPEPENVTAYNKWNEFVSDCDWYKKFIKPGERAGLKF